MRTVGTVREICEVVRGRRAEAQSIDFAAQVVGLQVAVGLRGDGRIAVGRMRCTAPGFTLATRVAVSDGIRRMIDVNYFCLPQK